MNEVKKIDPLIDRVHIPVTYLPGFRSAIAIQDGVERNLLFRTWGGLGDQICAEPTLRHVLKTFKGCEISLASEQPGLFKHLNFKKVFNLKEVQPIYKKYFLFDTITPPDDSNLVWQFFGHMTTNCVDFPSLCSIRSQLPITDREVKLVGVKPDLSLDFERSVFVHPGRHWQSKTFPKDWWDTVLSYLILKGVQPILIGANTDDNRGTVDVEVKGCVDLRNRTSIDETIWLLQQAKVFLTNDSSPLHMAVTGDAWIGYIATCKHPDYITHWRKGQWGYKMQNHGQGGLWDLIDYCPNKEQDISAESVPVETLLSWLPNPKEYAQWALSKL